MPISYETSELIRLKKAQYCRFADTKQWDVFEKLALPDAAFTFYGVGDEVRGEFSSTKLMIQAASSFFDGAQSSHRVGNSELSEISIGKVAAIWAMDDYVVFPARDGKPPSTMHGYGHYHEIWEEHDGDWLLKKLELKRTILEFHPVPDAS